MFYERTSRSASHFYERSSQYSFRRFPLAQGLWSGALPLRRRDALHDLCHGPLLLPDNGPLRELGGNLPLVLHTWNIFRNGTNGHLCSFRAISILTPEDANFRPQSEEAATSTRPSFCSCIGIYANSASSVTSQLISLRYIPGSVPFADTSRVWMDFFVRVTVR